MSGTGGFQTQAYNQPVMAIAGDFASNNPYFTFDAGQGGLVSGSGGVTVGNFAWVQYPTDADGTPSQVYNTPIASFGATHGFYGGGYVQPDGVVHREQQAMITTFLGYSSQVIVPGQQMSLMNGGDLWVVNSGTTAATYKQKAFARVVDGAVLFASSGSAGGVLAVATTAVISSQQFSGTGSITGNVLTITGNAAGGAYPGATVGAPGVGVIVAVLTGTPTGTGTFLLSMGEQSITSTNVVANYGQIAVSAGTLFTAPLTVGEIITGSGVVTAPATVLTWIISGASSTVTVTAVVNNTLAVATTTMTFAGAIETKWWALSTGLTGELIKITDHPPQ